jgi:hypothetical protein
MHRPGQAAIAIACTAALALVACGGDDVDVEGSQADDSALDATTSDATLSDAKLSDGTRETEGGDSPDERVDVTTLDAETMGGDGDATVIAETDADARPDLAVGFDVADPTCHYDCFGEIRCAAGVVTVFGRAAIPCWRWTGSCPVFSTLTCVKGCRTDDASVPYFTDPHEACEEGRPKVVGDRCVTVDDCLPTPALPTSTTTVENTYLRCDADAGTCVAADPPVVTDWLGPCSVDLAGVTTGAYGYVDAPSCTGGYCLISPSSGCVAEGCTKSCEHDWECPPGSVCEYGLSNVKPLDAGFVRGLCKPGPHRAIGIGLTCPVDGDAGDAGDAGAG